MGWGESHAKWDSLVERLRCPQCEGSLTFEPVPDVQFARAAYGTMRCRCYRYPVVDGVAIIQQHPVAVRSQLGDDELQEGPDPKLMAQRIADGDGFEVLVSLLAHIPTPWPLSKTSLGVAMGSSSRYARTARRFRARTIRRWLGRSDLVAEDWLSLYSFSTAKSGDFGYYYYRFSQPRYLASTALVASLPEPRAPILDLACGVGHVIHTLSHLYDVPVVGMDQNFHQLWTAQHWVVPDALFICGPADRALPFVDSAFDATLCTDAFHLFRDKQKAIAEMYRITRDRTTIVNRVGNVLRQPNEGVELDPAGYRELFGEPLHGIHVESTLRTAYLDGHSADGSLPGDGGLETEKWLSFITSDLPERFRWSNRFERWPHALGRLRLNPIYDQELRPDGSVALTFRFPTAHYRNENAEMLAYMPARAVVSAEEAADIEAGLLTERLDALVRDMVVVGHPERFDRGRGRRKVVTMNRTLSFVQDRMKQKMSRAGG